MSKKDRLCKEIDSLREKRQNLFSAILALVSGVVIVIYAVLSGDKPFYVVALSVLGFIVLVWFALSYSKIDVKIEKKLDELEKE